MTDHDSTSEFLQAVHDTVGGFPPGVHVITMATPKRFGEQYVLRVDGLQATFLPTPAPLNPDVFDERSRVYTVFLDHTEVSPVKATLP
jgi:hypothetical protein